MQPVNFRNLFLCLFVAVSASSNAQNKLPQLGKNSVHDIVDAMTPEEKASLVVGTGLRMAGNNAPVIGDADGRVPGAAGNTFSIERFNIPGSVLADGPAGVRIDPFQKGDSSKSYYATAFPVGTLLASSWDTTLIKKVGAAFGNEIREYGIDVILGPGMNIHRNPLNGRNFEYYSEDPVVTGYMASAMVQGIQSNGVGTSIKHFAANNQETKRGVINAIISERALREIYLRGFEIAVKNAQPWTVMSSYNKINGTYTSQSKDLLTDILRSEWGFKGIVMTDWYGGRDAIAQMKAGNDLIEPGGKNKTQAIVDAVKNGTLDILDLNKNVERILNYLLKTPSFQHYKYSNEPDLKAHAAISRNAATESMVLLKNEHDVLPLKKAARLALFGNGSYETIMGGTGSGEVNTAYAVSINQGLLKAGFKVLDNLKEVYTAYIQQDKAAHPKKPGLTVGAPHVTPEYKIDADLIAKSADEADFAIFTISRNAGEGTDRKIAADFNLSDTEKVVIENIASAFHVKGKRLIVVLNIGGAIETASWRNNADAILLAWQPGLEAGNAVADLLGGIVNPSGKLATTFPVKYEDDPSAKNFPGYGGKSDEVVYEEGIYVGYRYYNSFGVKPAFPFGYGLSYTTFSYSNLKLSSPGFSRAIKAMVTITNTGNVPGKEVVQLYLSAPQGKLDKPSEELKAFAKTALLKPGTSQTITFTLSSKDLASFNTTQSAWIADAGNYVVKIGASSQDIKQSKSFTLPKEMIVEKVNRALVPQAPINELKIADAKLRR
ncbi:MAG: Beta-glucosidase [Ferruginibacter sp.]|uniref:glycoside hydrolase family 3 C-terminal domain-containing protein n=1 Tax=Ferruginibacter sp. TaxID=1940288 RepID=UPI00265B1153|nr:glycoside hydrolase family 3 C-terminal domain-containing protein [Ferruginibacter sp.]MDB5279629.1 Beta-glucosidase [Ferruginibacter sp.]